MLVSQLETNMDLIRTLHPLARAWLLDGPLSSHLDAYLALLARLSQFTPDTAAKLLI